MKPLFTTTVCMACLLVLSSCKTPGGPLFDPKNPDVVDPALNLTRGDYSELAKPLSEREDKGAASLKTDGPPIPDLAPILAAPQSPKIAETKLVSIAVTDDIPLKDVLMELARLAEVDIEVDAGITGGIVFRAKDRPFNQVIQEIADLAGLRYSMKNSVLRIERDTPVVEIYPLDFINMDRSSTNSINLSTTAGGGSAGGSGGGSSGGGGGSGGSGGGSAGAGGNFNSGSQTTITSKSDSDFWKQFEDGIKQILAFSPALLSNASPVNAQVASGAAVPASGKKLDANAFYTINRQAGTLTISANQRQQELIKRFIKQIAANASSQVLIEAKIVEVDLNQQFQAGVDWSKIGNSHINFDSAANTFSAVGTTATNSPSLFTLNGDGLLQHGLDLNIAVNLLEAFGTTRTLSSPRLHAINNQRAVLTYAENYVYFQITATQATNSTVNGVTVSSPPTINSTVQTVPLGIILSLQPSIDLKNNEVTLDVRPTYSFLVDKVPDPAAAFILAQSTLSRADQISLRNNIPKIAVREMDSIVKLKSGSVAVIGGYMEDKGVTNDNGLPYVSSIPIVGNLFKGVNRERGMKELVIFLRATIVDSNGNAQDADKAFYKKFIQDPRPLDF